MCLSSLCKQEVEEDEKKKQAAAEAVEQRGIPVAAGLSPFEPPPKKARPKKTDAQKARAAELARISRAKKKAEKEEFRKSEKEEAENKGGKRPAQDSYALFGVKRTKK